ncbi:MAG: LL-diaminopimelate aminotransferase [Phycisphaerales bacterium]|nr:LL-diaminopimelate aminotransferase [Phycisphaerales bacterium]
MSDPYFQTLFADRIGGAGYGKGTEIYKFEQIKRAKRAAIQDFPDRPLLDFGIGENDDMAPPSIRQSLQTEVDKLENRGYADNGIQEYKDAAAAFMRREFGVTIDPAREINHCIGTKTALAMLPAAFINPNDVTLMTVPGYPVAGTHTRYYGGQVFALPLREENGFLPDLDAVPADVCRRAKLLVINYPNSPTGGLADEAFYRKVIDFAQANQIVVINDATHILFTYGRRPLSFLQVDGAKEVGVEVHSMSKGFNMIGWRLGFVVGHELIVRAFADVKDNSDSGQFIAIQKAAAAALADASIPVAIRTKYERRLRKLVATLSGLGFEARMPGGTYFLYVRAPRRIEGGPEFASAADVSQYLIRQRSVCTVPWDDAGPYLRWSVTYQAADEPAEDVLMNELKRRLSEDRFVWE